MIINYVLIIILLFSVWYVSFLLRTETFPFPEITEKCENDDIRIFSENNLYENFINKVKISKARPIVQESENNNNNKSNTIVDCSITRRYCFHDVDCESLCKPFDQVVFKCDSDYSQLCYPNPIEDEDDPGKIKCDTKIGEYALLVGYTTIGVAIWQCVQLYRHYADSSKFCEGGKFEMNADLREPSYRDCTCPKNHIRAIYSMTSAYDNSIPHCVPIDNWKFYEWNMIEK